MIVRGARGFLCSAICGCVLLVSSGAAFANPQGGVVSAGRADISSAGRELNIHQHSERAVIDWRSFDIEIDETTRFHQPSSSAIVLNRISGAGGASRIDGALKANGHVVLINPNGVLFGAGSRVDVGSLSAATADITNEKFMAGKMDFSIPGHPDGAIVNAGQITVKEAGLVSLVAPHVENHGVIEAKAGAVHLASGEKFTLDLAGDSLLQVAVDADHLSGSVTNSGRIKAAGGKIALTAAAARDVVDGLIVNTGSLEARSLENKNGKIILTAQGSNKTEKTGNSSVINHGLIEADGDIELLADHVGLMDGSVIDASEDNRGGQVLIGGDYQGQGDVQTAKRTYVASDAQISANAQSSGDGGRVIVWADEITRFYGTLEAKGAGQSGAGGFAEISGKQTLDYQGRVDLTAPQGRAGTLLLDPTDITISNMANTQVSGASPFAPSADNVASNLNIATLQNALAGADIIVQTRAGGAQQGNITLADALAWASGHRLTLDAHNDIALDGAITAASGGLTLRAGGDITASEAINLNRFVLETGNWVQNGTLPDFSAQEFIVNAAGGANFLRAAGGNGTAIPFEITDEYGLQGVATNNAYGNIIYAYRGGSSDHNGVYFGQNGVRQNDGTDGLGFNADGTRYLVHKFIESGSFTPVAGVDEVEYLIVGGGGGGGKSEASQRSGGGGGAGGYLAGSTNVTAITYNFSIGAGGDGALGQGGSGNEVGTVRSGENTTAFGLTALGGGGGGNGGAGNGATGGSGGGGGRGSAGLAGAGTPGQGNDGGSGTGGTVSTSGGAGGGGAGASGQNGAVSNGGAGGAGVITTITGTQLAKAGGGGGAVLSGTAGSGGVGGGGDGSSGSNARGNDGQAGTGGGGGGATTTADGGNGGSGIVVVRYAAPVLTIGGSFDVDDKLYDGTDTATIAANNLAPAGVAGLANVALSGLTLNPAFADIDAGGGITVNLNPTAGGLSGGNAAFYDLSLNNPVTGTGNITPAPLSVRALDLSFTQGQPGIPEFIFSGFVNNETLSNSGVTGQPALGINLATLGPGLHDLTPDLSGLSATNYTFIAGTPVGRGTVIALPSPISAPVVPKVQRIITQSLNNHTPKLSGVGTLSSASPRGVIVQNTTQNQITINLENPSLEAAPEIRQSFNLCFESKDTVCAVGSR